MGIGDWVMAAVGGATFVAALVVLGKARSHQITQAEGDHGPDGDGAGPGGISLPTRFVTGIGLALAGYHMVAHALPAAWVPLKVPGDRLWILAVGVVGAIAVSHLIDVVERRGAP